ncbi:MAG: hypothetical protein FWD59_01430 [Micrococcales bacterium]|nr:hypothetical protein [Micrococcales bacterium]
MTSILESVGRRVSSSFEGLRTETLKGNCSGKRTTLGKQQFCLAPNLGATSE